MQVQEIIAIYRLVEQDNDQWNHELDFEQKKKNIYKLPDNVQFYPFFDVYVHMIVTSLFFQCNIQFNYYIHICIPRKL
jgi:hypothetical protein